VHLHTILAFAFLFLQTEQPASWRVVGPDDVFVTLILVMGQPLFWGSASALAARRVGRLIAAYPETPQVAQRFHHHAIMVLRASLVLMFGVTVLFTPWPDWLELRGVSPALQVFGDLAVLLPFFASAAASWIGFYPLDRTLRKQRMISPTTDGMTDKTRWGIWQYLDFNFRHHILIVTVPLTIILFAFNATYGYESTLRNWTGWIWAPDALLGVVAFAVFVTAPLMLIRVWRTHPLEESPLRDRLEAVCTRIGLKYRDILVWTSDGMMINAAVMGLSPRVRYVLLSDGLLEAMNAEQIEAVFGHEGGHVKHRHIQHFLLFAFVGWAVVAGLMELLLKTATGNGAWFGISVPVIEGIGLGATVVYWGVGFGWLSRRFERQADVFGARCAAPSAERCEVPCSLHLDTGTVREGAGGVCATGVAVFTSALERVALLNGIPHEERNWRHSSIGSRIRFLSTLAGDPGEARRFSRLVHRVKSTLRWATIVGSVLALCYYLIADPAITRSGSSFV